MKRAAVVPLGFSERTPPFSQGDALSLWCERPSKQSILDLARTTAVGSRHHEARQGLPHRPHHGGGRGTGQIAAVRLPLLAVAFLLLGTRVEAQPTYNYEFWPEIDLHHWFGPNTQIIVMGSTNRDRDSGSAYQGEFGATVEHRFTDWFRGRIGYRHGNALDGSGFYENRLLTEQTFRMRLPAEVIVGFRTREDFRWLNTGYSMRFRERIQVQRDLIVGRYSFTPYGSTEVYYDTRYGQFSRYRLTAGSTFPTVRGVAVEPYFTHQVDFASGTSITDALGLILHATF
jgi:hypothetical protein